MSPAASPAAVALHRVHSRVEDASAPLLLPLLVVLSIVCGASAAHSPIEGAVTAVSTAWAWRPAHRGRLSGLLLLTAGQVVVELALRLP